MALQLTLSKRLRRRKKIAKSNEPREKKEEKDVFVRDCGDWNLFLLSVHAVSIKNLKDPKVEAFADNWLLAESCVMLPQSVPIEQQNHCLSKRMQWLLDYFLTPH